MVGSKRVLVTLGEEDGMRAPVVKVWDLERWGWRRRFC
jgi:hypothetical protein